MRRAGLLAALALLPAVPGVHARKPAPPTGTLTLALPDPIVAVEVAGVPLRLRMALDGRGVVTLNRAAVARLPLAFEKTDPASVGRVELPGIAAPAALVLEGRTVPVALWSYGDCCDGVDGAIDARLLPFAQVRLLRPGAPAGEARSFALRPDDDYGTAARETVAGRALSIQFALDRTETLATASAGAILARAWGGRFDGPYAPAPVAWGVQRPARLIAFAREGRLAGFRFASLRTRTADFAGRDRLPSEPVQPDEILVRRRHAPQHGWPAVSIGRDRLDRCGEMRFDTRAMLLTLRCDWTG